MVPWNSASGGLAYNWQSKWVGIIAIKTEKTQIHFLSDVLVAVAPLDLKVPIVSSWPRWPGWALLPSQLFVSNLNGLPFFERNCRKGWLARFNSSGRWETLLSGTSFLHINGRDCYFADGQTSAKALESIRDVVVHFVVHLNSVEPHRNSYLSKMVNILLPTLVFRISWGFLVSLP